MMRSQIIAQRNFSGGQIDDTALRADDTKIHAAGLRKARNVRILNTRALKRRPGRRYLFDTTGICELVRPVPDETWFMVLEPHRVVFRRRNLAQSVAFDGMPWDAAMLSELRWVENDGAIVVVHQRMRPQVFGYAKANSTWSHSPFQFAQDQNYSMRQPYHPYHSGTGIQMQVSGRYGNVVVTFTGDVLSPGHVGVRFRYAGRQVHILEVWSARQALAWCAEVMPPSFVVRVDNLNGLQVADLVEGVTSGARGQVVWIDNNPVTVNVPSQVPGSEGSPKGGVQKPGVPIPTTPQTGFNICILCIENWGGWQKDEVMAGPLSKMKVQEIGNLEPLPTSIWDEALMSDFRGWPGVVGRDQQRIIFAKFPQAGPGVCWSAINTLNDFRVGAAKGDAIFEIVPENCTVQDVVGGADEFIFTDKGTYYVPISTSNPLSPGSIEFRKISDDASSPLRPKETLQGMVFVNAGLSRVLGIIATGQVARPYIIEDATEYHTPLIRSPVVITSTTADIAAPERYLYLVNADGTVAVARYSRASAEDIIGWVPWDGAGKVEWVTSLGPDVVFTVTYQTPAGTLRFVEVLEDGLLLDATRPLASVTGADMLELSPGVPLEVSPGSPFIIRNLYSFNWAAGVELAVVQNGWYRGSYTVAEDGSLSNEIPVQNTVGLMGGFNFEVEAEPFLPHADPGEDRGQRMRRRRIEQVSATVLRTQAIEVGGRLIPYWKAGENEEEAPPLRDETHRHRFLGRDFDPRWSVKQTLPGALTLLELTTKVTI